ncbi:uncharacterized protein [Epargyreus clarus]|uniref:uncharacterized protein n=1 Tax=Epargyreus clarus TaxID=520877 RepID=UPI003C2F99AC
MSAESPRHARSGGPLTVPSQPPSDRSIIDAVSGFINDVTLSSSSAVDPKDVIQWARFETADINEPTPEGDGENDVSPLLLILGYGSGVQVWLIPPNGEAQEVLSWRQGTVRVLRILPTPQHGDCFASKRPLIALCDSASPGPAFCSLSFISIRGGEQVKSIKFKNPILDVLANKRSVVVSFSERFAVFDAGTLEDRLAVTTCYPCPCPLGGSAPINPIALGDRWLAYADKKLNPSKRSSGGCEGEGVSSYTASVLHAAKSLSKGLRGLGESVAHSLAGRAASQSPSPPHADQQHAGLVTVLDIEQGIDEEDGQDCEEPCDPVVAHFIAHSEAIIALKFDPSGMLLITADRRGHDFHVFRINPHPCGPNLASVHHLYILHRGDTTAKVQDIAVSGDSRWAAVSTLRGTTHVFALSPYGGACGVRTHTQPRVVNRLSRFHRSAGLPIHAHAHGHTHAHAHSPVVEGWFPNPRLPPFPLPCTAAPLAQLRPTHNLPTHTITRTSSGRQRLSSLSEDSNAAPLLARACFGAGAAGARAAVALYLMAAGGELLHLVLHPRPARNVPKEKICDDSPIELEVEAVAQWPLQRPPAAADLLAPLPPSNPLLQPLSCRRCADMCMSEEERWLSQVEIVTHAGPHRRLWMGPQFVFKTYNCTGSNSSLSEAETVEVEATGAARSTPVNMPGVRPIVPVLIDSGSASSLEHSPSDSFRRKSLLAEGGRAASVCDVQLREDLAEAMKEDHGWPRERDGPARRTVERAVDPLGTVVAPPAGRAAPAPRDPDRHTRSNADEATFRPVVRAPAPPPHAALVVRPLPRTTTIPAERAPPAAPAAPAQPPARARPLTTDVVIPAVMAAALAAADWPLDDDDDDAGPVLPISFDDDSPLGPPPPLGLECGLGVAPVNLDKIDVDVKKNISISEDLVCERDERERERCDWASARAGAACDSEPATLPKCDRPSDDIQPASRPRVKKSPTVKSASDRAAGDVSVKDGSFSTSGIKLGDDDLPKVASEETKLQTAKDQGNETKNKKAETIVRSQQLSSSNQHPDTKASNKCESEIKTEEQAWDLLLNDPDPKSATPQNEKLSLTSSDKIDDSKLKTKKSRKSKKSQDELQAKADDDSFVEIHNIEEKQQPPSGDLVSISTPFEDIEPTISYSSKTKRSRSSKSHTPETEGDCDVKSTDTVCQREQDTSTVKLKTVKKRDSAGGADDCATLSEQNFTVNSDNRREIKTNKSTDLDSGKNKSRSEYSQSSGCTPSSSLGVKESPKHKSKSPSPNSDSRKCEKVSDIEKKEVYVINTTDDDFPEIQITRATKPHRKSPQPEKKNPEKEVVADKPVKSWSSIAASKNVKKVEDVEKTIEVIDKDEPTVAACSEEQPKSCKVSLQEKLMELCKRTDIMVAECDAPSELNFVDEHHSVLHDLPPLEPLDFGLDDFKLEVMRDSLLDMNDPKVTSPICKINIDDILSSIKETTSKVIESSTFNLIDIEKVPSKREKGFSVVETDKITSQDVKLDDENKETEIMEKSSDDDAASPVLSADSDKEDKKNIGATNTALPSKQASKSKKSRKKKK